MRHGVDPAVPVVTFQPISRPERTTVFSVSRYESPMRGWKAFLLKSYNPTRGWNLPVSGNTGFAIATGGS